ncbi:DUF2788 domain-containing protein [Alkalimarinus alittae]|uniref:DUF2788 domain-containing protein n=1 Tax=Alkalimarinus alittae TaxID=2961619 RepID=A0ABY6N6D3_9ALTE|nr:DUF2788 domain-containing protein [Alkalimarinus alittae]UZE97575.1 DUF2788 domain-containing protein [Alkalimarinus alittae]
MSIAQFESISLTVLITALVCYMGYIVWDLAKRSEAGKIGTIALFGALGLGVMGFIIKTVLIEVINV